MSPWITKEKCTLLSTAVACESSHTAHIHTCFQPKPYACFSFSHCISSYYYSISSHSGILITNNKKKSAANIRFGKSEPLFVIRTQEAPSMDLEEILSNLNTQLWYERLQAAAEAPCRSRSRALCAKTHANMLWGIEWVIKAPWGWILALLHCINDIQWPATLRMYRTVHMLLPELYLSHLWYWSLGYTCRLKGTFKMKFPLKE